MGLKNESKKKIYIFTSDSSSKIQLNNFIVMHKRPGKEQDELQGYNNTLLKNVYGNTQVYTVYIIFYAFHL